MIATTSLTITGIVKIITTSPVKDFLISLAAGGSWDGIKKTVSHFSENSTEKKIWNIFSGTMSQFYGQLHYEYDETIVVKCLLDELAQENDNLTSWKLQKCLEKAMFDDFETLSDQEFGLWVSIFANRCAQYPEIFQMYFKHQSSAAVYNILKELVIKKDIAIGKITLVDWSQYGYKADWLFGVVVDGTYYFMTIHPDGSFKIEALKRNLFTMTEYDKYMDYFGLNEENKNDYRGVIGLVKDAEGNINLIKDTNMYSMPDYTAMGDVLKNVASEGRFPGKDVVTWLRLVMDTTDKIKVHAELDIVIPHIDVNAEYTKANVMGLFKGITTKKEVVRYVFENTGIMLYAYLRGEEERREYLSGNIDINYFDYDDTHAKYSVGEIGNGMKYTIERASVVREIQAVEGSKLIFKKVLPLMGVEFVRYGMLTVVPFPFKYLREYIVKEEKSV